VMSPAGRKARLSTLIFHRVLPEPDVLFPGEMHAQRFHEVCRWLGSWFNVLPLDSALVQMKAGTLPERAACITFDDGYADNYRVAMPILQQHGLTATFFISTGFLDGGRMWNDTIIEVIRAYSSSELDLTSLGLGTHSLASTDAKKAAISALINQIKYLPIDERISITEKIAQLAQMSLPVDLMLTAFEVKAMRQAGMQIGAHTVSHPILARLPEHLAHIEIKNSRNVLEQILGERIGLFAYPNGKPGEDYTLETVSVVQNLGFDGAVSTEWGTSGADDDPFQIRRFTPWDTSRLKFGARLLSNLRHR
jgi:peptidoglycan/xylan/chitin deacetylase (PgdA/CDA1 family)